VTTPAEIKMRLEQKLQELRATITDVHSVSLEDGVVHVGFDVTDASGDWTLFFAFERPELVSKHDLYASQVAGRVGLPRRDAALSWRPRFEDVVILVAPATLIALLMLSMFFAMRL
jgi:hypothetical protein